MKLVNLKSALDEDSTNLSAEDIKLKAELQKFYDKITHGVDAKLLRRDISKSDFAQLLQIIHDHPIFYAAFGKEYRSSRLSKRILGESVCDDLVIIWSRSKLTKDWTIVLDHKNFELAVKIYRKLVFHAPECRRLFLDCALESDKSMEVLKLYDSLGEGGIVDKKNCLALNQYAGNLDELTAGLHALGIKYDDTDPDYQDEEEDNLITQGSFDYVIDSEHPRELGNAFRTLSDKKILTPENISLVSKHTEPDELAQALAIFQDPFNLARVHDMHNINLIERYAKQLFEAPDPVAFAKKTLSELSVTKSKSLLSSQSLFKEPSPSTRVEHAITRYTA